MQRYQHTGILYFLNIEKIREKKALREERGAPSQCLRGPRGSSGPVGSICDQATCKCLDHIGCLVEQASATFKRKKKGSKIKAPAAGFVPHGPAPPILDKGCILGLNLELDQSSSISQNIRLDWRQRNSRWSFCSLELKDLVNLVPRQLHECCVQMHSRKQLPLGGSKKNPTHIQKSEVLAVVWFL